MLWFLCCPFFFFFPTFFFDEKGSGSAPYIGTHKGPEGTGGGLKALQINLYTHRINGRLLMRLKVWRLRL